MVVIPFVSMHESTRRLVELLTRYLSKEGIIARPYNLIKADLGNITMDLVDAAALVVASPTVLAGAHPAVISFAYLVNGLRPKTKLLGVIGSYGWNGKVMVEHIKNTLKNVKSQWLEPFLVKGAPKEEDVKRLEGFAKELTSKVKGLSTLP